MGKLATNIGPYLDMVGSVIGILYSSVGIRYDSPELTYLRTMYKRIENRFDQIDQHLKGIAREVQWNRYSSTHTKVKSELLKSNLTNYTMLQKVPYHEENTGETLLIIMKVITMRVLK